MAYGSSNIIRWLQNGVVAVICSYSIAMAAPASAPKVPAEPAAVPAPTVIDDSYILPYLEQVIAWHRSLIALEVSQNNPQEILLDENLRKSANKVLKLAFNFAKSEASLLDEKNENI